MATPTSPLPTRSAAEALVVAALLRAHGIPVYVAGQLLQDEFGVTQRLLGGTGAVLEVPTTDLLRAQAVLSEAREGGPDDDQQGPPGAP